MKTIDEIKWGLQSLHQDLNLHLSPLGGQDRQVAEEAVATIASAFTLIDQHLWLANIKMKVKITDDRDRLARIWSESYARNAGKILEVDEIRENGTVVCNGWNFSSELYERVTS